MGLPCDFLLGVTSLSVDWPCEYSLGGLEFAKVTDNMLGAFPARYRVCTVLAITLEAGKSADQGNLLRVRFPDLKIWAEEHPRYITATRGGDRKT